MPPILKTRSRCFMLFVLTLSLMQTVVAQVRSYNQVLVDRGIEAATTGNYKKAIEYFDASIQLESQFAPAYYHRGTVRTRIPWIFDKSKAIEDFEMAIRLNPEYAEAYVELGRARKEIGHLDKAISINPNLARAYYWRGRVREQLANSNPETSIFDYAKAISLDRRYAEAYLAKGQAHRKMGEHQAAVANLTRAIQFLPKQVDAYEDRGLARLALGDETGALQDFVQIIRLAKTVPAINPPPTSPSGEPGRYTSHLDKLKPSPALAKAYYEEGMAYRYVGDKPRLALPSFNRAIELNPNSAAVYYQRSLLLLADQKRAEAIEDLTRAIQLAPSDPDCYYARGRAYFDAADFAKALSDFNESIRLSSKAVDVHYWRGRALYNVGDKTKAIADFSTAITTNPQNAAAYFWRGLAVDDLGESQRAGDDYLKVTQLRPLREDDDQIVAGGNSFGRMNYYRGRTGLALVDEQMPGDDAEKADRQAYLNRAVEDFSRYITASPGAAEAYFWRGRTRKLLGQLDLANADLTQAIRMTPTFYVAMIERARDISPPAIGKKDLNYIVRVKPNWARGYYERAAHLMRSQYNPPMETVQAALSDLNRAIEIDPNLVDAYRKRAYIRRGYFNDANGAIADINQVIRLDPDDLDACKERAYFRLEAKDFGGAVEDFSRAIELSSRESPGLMQLYAGRARARYEIGDGIGSEHDNQQVRDRAIDDCRNCNLGTNLAKAKKADSIFQKGLSLALRGDTREARSNFEEALRLYQAAGRMSDCEKAKYELGKL